jgi:hypothetical protein
MPSDYRIDRPRSLVISRSWGMVTDQDLLGHARALGRDPHFRSDMRQLYDFREVTIPNVGSATVLELANLSPFGVGARRACIVGSEVAFGMARMFQMLRDTARDEIQVFREAEPALEWLGLTEDAADVLAELAAIRPAAGSA